jgi:hypothetical protein
MAYIFYFAIHIEGGQIFTKKNTPQAYIEEFDFVILETLF